MLRVIFILTFLFYTTPFSQCLENDILSQLESYNQRCQYLLKKGNLSSVSKESAEIFPFIHQHSTHLFDLKDKKESILFESIGWSVFSLKNLSQINDVIDMLKRYSFEYDAEKSTFFQILTALKLSKGMHADKADEIDCLLNNLNKNIALEHREKILAFDSFLESKSNFQEIYNRFVLYKKEEIASAALSFLNTVNSKKSYLNKSIKSDSFKHIEIVINAFLTSSFHTGSPKIIVSFDFDDTLLSKLDRLELHRDYYSELKERHPHLIDESTKNISKIVKKTLSLLQNSYIVKEEFVIDPLAKDLISKLHECNISTMILTARQTHIHNLTIESLFKNNINLMPNQNEKLLDLSPQYLYNSENDDLLYGRKNAGPAFQDNIIYTCFELKGPHIQTFFERTNSFPDLFVHIDDNEEQCKSIANHMSKHCNTIVIHYNYTSNLLFKNNDDIIHYLRNNIDHDSIETVIKRLSEE